MKVKNKKPDRNPPTRVEPKEAADILRRSRVTGWRRLQEIKEFFDIPMAGFVSPEQFSMFTGVKLETVLLHLR